VWGKEKADFPGVEHRKRVKLRILLKKGGGGGGGKVRRLSRVRPEDSCRCTKKKGRQKKKKKKRNPVAQANRESEGAVKKMKETWKRGGPGGKKKIHRHGGQDKELLKKG